MKKTNFVIYFLILISSLYIISCKDEVTGNSTPEPIPNPYSTLHFTFYYTSYDSLYIKAIADSAEKHYSRILGDLLIDTVLKTSVHFHKTHEELAAAVPFSIPSWAIGLSTAKDEIHMISPKHPDQTYEYMIIVLIHEFTHCVTLNLRPSFANNPRWLWESVALYEAGQFIHPSQLSYMVQQDPPTLSEMNSINNTQVYEAGYLLTEYIVETWDRQHLKDLILTNGNLSQSLGVTTAEFQTGWFQFVKNKYSI